MIILRCPLLVTRAARTGRVVSAACLATHAGSGHALAAHTGTGDDLLGTCWLWMRCLVVLRRVDLASRAATPGRVGPAAWRAIRASARHAEDARTTHGGDERVRVRRRWLGVVSLDAH